MVLLKTTLVGVILVVAGILLLTFAGSYITVQVQAVQRHEVEPHAQFLVGDVEDKQYSLPGNVTVTGTIDVAQAPSNQSSSIQFTVLDSQNYPAWAAGQQASSIFTSNPQGHANFTFNTASEGVYHFVFDNRASTGLPSYVYKKYVTLSVGYNEVSVSSQPDQRVPYVAWGFLAVGLVVLIYGLARKAPIPWA